MSAQPWTLKPCTQYGTGAACCHTAGLVTQPLCQSPGLRCIITHHTTPAGSSRGTVPDPRGPGRQRTMWVIMATALPRYLPSVLRGDRLKKLAPARWATAWHTEVFPVRGAPYRSTALAQGSLQGGSVLSLDHPASPPRQPQTLPVLSEAAGTMGQVHQRWAQTARLTSSTSRLSACSKQSPRPCATGKRLPTSGSHLWARACQQHYLGLVSPMRSSKQKLVSIWRTSPSKHHSLAVP